MLFAFWLLISSRDRSMVGLTCIDVPSPARNLFLIVKFEKRNSDGLKSCSETWNGKRLQYCKRLHHVIIILATQASKSRHTVLLHDTCTCMQFFCRLLLYRYPPASIAMFQCALPLLHQDERAYFFGALLLELEPGAGVFGLFIWLLIGGKKLGIRMFQLFSTKKGWRGGTVSLGDVVCTGLIVAYWDGAGCLGLRVSLPYGALSIGYPSSRRLRWIRPPVQRGATTSRKRKKKKKGGLYE